MADRPVQNVSIPNGLESDDSELNEMLYAAHAEVSTLKDLEDQRGTPIPALFNQFYKFIQNPSSVSVETFKRMIDTDDTLGSGVDFLTTCLAARLGRYQHKSEEVTSWVNDRLAEIEGGWFNVVKSVLSASWAGFSVSEKVWANTENGFVPKRLITLPPGTILFETERTGELTDDGILQYQRNYNPNLLGAGMSVFGNIGGFGWNGDVAQPDFFAKYGDLPFPIRSANTYNYLSVRIPVRKCVHYAFDAQGKFNNPYGRSLLRRAYKYYVMKDAFLQMLSIALDRKGTPLTIVYCDPNLTLVDPSKSAQGNQKGKVSGIRADVAAREAFRNIHNDTTIFLPGKKDQNFSVDFAAQSANQDAFIAAIDLCNKSMLRALLVPSLIFGNGDGTGSFALGQEHSKTFDKILDGMLAGAKQVLLEQLVREMVAYNFPKEVWEKDGIGDFSKREMSQDEKGKELEVVETAVNLGAVDMNDLNDLNKIREIAGFEPKDEIIEQENEGGFDEFGNPVEGDVDDEGNPIEVQGDEEQEPEEGEESGQKQAGFPPKKGARKAPPKKAPAKPKAAPKKFKKSSHRLGYVVKTKNLTINGKSVTIEETDDGDVMWYSKNQSGGPFEYFEDAVKDAKKEVK